MQANQAGELSTKRKKPGERGKKEESQRHKNYPKLQAILFGLQALVN